MPSRSVGRIVAAVLACLSMKVAQAACSRTIHAAYPMNEVAAMFEADPSRGFPSLPDAIARSSGCVIAVHQYPLARMWKLFREGNLDLVLMAAQSDSTESQARFFPVLKSPWDLLTEPTFNPGSPRLEDLIGHRPLRVGIVRGGQYLGSLGHWIARLRRYKQLDEATDLGSAIRKLEAGRDAAVLVPSALLDHLPAGTLSASTLVTGQTSLPPVIAGLYLNRRSMGTSDQESLEHGIDGVISQHLIAELLGRRSAGPSGFRSIGSVPILFDDKNQWVPESEK